MNIFVLKKIYKKIPVIISLLVNLLSFSQDKPVDHYSLIKGINTNNNLNAGTVKFNIPLYNIEVGDLTLNSNLEYESTGFLPIFQPGIAGINWNVNLIGKIVREVNNVSLERDVTLYNLEYSSPGGNQPDYHDCIKPQDVKNFGFTKKDLMTNPALIINSPNQRYNPDKFYFDFFGYKGYFVFDNEAKPIVYCENANLKVLTSGISCQSVYMPIDFSEFVIVDEKGNEFYFGGDYKTLDVNYTESKYTYNYTDYNNISDSKNYVAKTRTNYTTGWNLKKVKLYDGKEIIVNYQDQQQNILTSFSQEGLKNPKDLIFLNDFPQNSILEANNLSVSTLTKKSTSQTENTGHQGFPLSSTVQISETTYYTKEAVVQNIIIPDIASINFHFNKSQNTLEKFRNYISSIEVKDAHNRLIDLYNFEMVDYGLVHKRTFLKSFKKNQLENYSFDYQKVSDFPDYSGAVNKMGYWLDNDDAGLLKKIYLPTKGYVLYFYEPNTAHYKYTRTGQNYNDFSIVEEINNNVGGVRLSQQIETSLDNQGYIKTKYYYVRDDGKSSGIVEDSTPKNSSTSFGYFDQNNLSYAYTIYSSYYYGNRVKYSNVIIKTEKGEIKYDFTDHFSNPDQKTMNIYVNGCGYNPTYNPFIYKNKERGRVKRIRQYTTNKKLLLDTQYTYTNFLDNLSNLQNVNDACTDCKITDDRYYVFLKGHHIINSGYNCTGIGYMYVPILPVLLKSKNTKEYLDDNKIIESAIEYKYNGHYLYWHPHPREIIMTTPLGITKSNIYYPGDLLLENPTCIINYCVDNNLTGERFLTYKNLSAENINIPVITTSTNIHEKKSLLEKIIKKNTSTSDKWRVTEELESALDSDFTSIGSVSTIKKIEYQLYDNRGNIIQQQNNQGIFETIIWGYNQTKPIVKIIGGTYSQIMQAFNLDPNSNISYLQLDIVSKSNSDADENTEVMLHLALDNFKKHPELSAYLISTYTYDPLIGLSSETTPSGAKTLYKYDSFNRLSKVSDQNNKSMQKYYYNYTNQLQYPATFFSSEISQTFTRDNCGGRPSGSYLGLNYNYTVPEGSYASTISQVDADQKAQADLIQNGQSLANQYAACLTAYCSFQPIFVTAQQSEIFKLTQNKFHFRVYIRTYQISRNWYEWSNIGTIPIECKPATTWEFTYVETPAGSLYPNPNRTWQIRLNQNGYVSVKLLSGSLGSQYYDGAYFNFEYQK